MGTVVLLCLAAILLGCIDPLEGWPAVFAGVVLVSIGAALGASRHRRWLFYAAGLVTIGAGAMVALTAVGGFGGNSGRSLWWGLVLLPYPMGAIIALVGAVRMLWERRTTSA